VSALALRSGKREDRALIGHSWTMSYEGAPAVRGAERDHYREEMRRLIDRILAKATVRVMCDAKDEDTIVGWVAFTGSELHYGFVKDEFRKSCSLSDLLKGVHIDAYSFRGRHIEHALVGIEGCRFDRDEKSDRVTWSPPKGWRFTPRFTF
jgi:hypothetical protein